MMQNLTQKWIKKGCVDANEDANVDEKLEEKMGSKLG